jgi:FtsP/CotA-like multicopper oxidase with cupredoxin domain
LSSTYARGLVSCLKFFEMKSLQILIVGALTIGPCSASPHVLNRQAPGTTTTTATTSLPTWTSLPLPTACVGGGNGSPCYRYSKTWVVTSTTSMSSQGTPVSVHAVDVDNTGPRWPPPVVSVTRNDRVRIVLVNKLGDDTKSENVTLHFHGLLQQNGYGSMDGPETIVQW